MKPLPDLHASVKAAVNNSTDALRNIGEVIPKMHQRRPALILAPLSTSNCVLAPCITELPIPHKHSDAHNACLHAPITVPPALPVILTDGLLIGRITCTSMGVLHITTLTTTHPLYITPTAPPSLRNALVYLADWRFLPSHIEVLLHNIHSLTLPAAPCPSNIPLLSPSIPFSSRKPISVSGCVSAKSPILSSRTAPCFLVELTSHPAAVILVFRGHAVSWWPFIRLDTHLSFTGLRLAHLPSFRRTVLRANNATNIFTSLPQPLTLHRPPPPASTFAHTPAPGPSPGPSPSPSPAAHLVRYQGVITRVLSEGRYELDDRILLHLGPFRDVTGPGIGLVILRKGVTIEAFYMFTTRHHTRITLFPTARTVLNVLFFGNLILKTCITQPVAWRHTQWAAIWKRWSYIDIAFAEHLYMRLAEKFRPWLCDVHANEDGNGDDEDLRSCLLGNGNNNCTGLVQYVMFLLTKCEKIVSLSNFPARNLYAEFINPLSAYHTRRNCANVMVPSLSELICAIQSLWKDSMLRNVSSQICNIQDSQLLDNHNGGNNVDAHRAVFDAHEIGEQLAMTNGIVGHSTRERGIWKNGDSLAVIGKLDGLKDGSITLTLCDTSATIAVQSIGTIQPSILGGIILMTSFRAISEVGNNNEQCVTLVVDADRLGVVMDGHCVRDAGRDEQQEDWDAHDSDVEASGRVVNLSGRGGNACVMGDVPQICMFVERVVGGGSQVFVDGKLMGVWGGDDSMEATWAVILDDGSTDVGMFEFPKCRLRISGDAALRMAGGFTEGCVFGVSCTELLGCGDARRYLREKAEGGGIVRLELQMRERVPWVENLGRGVYMRFESGKGGEDWEGGGVSEEGGVYMGVCEAVERMVGRVERGVEGELWRLYGGFERGKGDCAVDLKGVVTQVGVEVEQGVRVWSVRIRDEVLGVYDVVVRVYGWERMCRIGGLIVGMRVVMMNVRRVEQQGGGGGC